MNDNWWALASLVLSLAFTGLGWRLLASGRRFMYAHLWMACLLALQTGALCVKAYQTGMCPIRGASEVIFFLSWTINLFYLLLGRAYRMSVLGIFTAPAIAVLTALSLLIGLFGPDVQGAHDFWGDRPCRGGHDVLRSRRTGRRRGRGLLHAGRLLEKKADPRHLPSSAAHPARWKPA